jgi:hypothetical protein
MTEEHMVLWWIPAGHIPGLNEGLARLDLVRSQGASPLAFTFRDPYSAPAETAATHS